MGTPIALIKTALDSAVQHLNSGASPDAALEKSAREYALNPNFIHRVGESLNVALHYNHFKHASDRAADFPIADIPGVVTRIFGAKTKTASEERSEWVFGADLEHIPDFNSIVSDPMSKAAYVKYVQDGRTATNTNFTTSLSGLSRQASNYILKLSGIAETAESEARAAEFSMEAEFCKLADHFKKTPAARIPFEEFESQVFTKHASVAVPYLDLLSRTLTTGEPRGVHDDKYWAFEQCKEATMFDRLMDKIAEFHERRTVAEDAKYNLSFEKEYWDGTFNKQANKALEEEPEHTAMSEAPPPIDKSKKEAPEVQKSTDVDPIGNPSEKDAADLGDISYEDLEKEAGATDFLMDRVLKPLFSSAEGPAKSSNPLASTGTDNLERQMLLQELIMTDPILRKEPASKVINAYQQILRISPHVSKEKEIVRALLRQMVSVNAFEPHSAKQVTDLEDAMNKQKLGLNPTNNSKKD